MDAPALRVSPYVTVYPPLPGAVPIAGGCGSLLSTGAQKTGVAPAPGATFVLSHLFIHSARAEVSGAELRALAAAGCHARLGAALSPERIRELIVHGLLIPSDARLPWRVRLEAGIDRVVIRSWGGLGDVVMTTPLLRTLRGCAPALRIAVSAIGEDDFNLLECSPYIDEIWLRHADDANVGASDLVFEPRYGLLAPTRTAKVGIAHVVASCFGVELDSPLPALCVSDADEGYGDQVARSLGPFVAVHATSRRVQKDWPTERWSELIVPQHELVQLGTRADLLIAGARDLRGLPIRRSLAVLKRARAFVGVDSVLQHAAVAFGVPSVVLFGPTPPEVYGHPGSVVLRAECACHRDVAAWIDCRKRCMSSLSAAAVGAALGALLDASRCSAASAIGGK